MTKFNFHLHEFKTCVIKEEMVCTYSLRPVMEFLQIWDPKIHRIDSYYDPAQGVPVLFHVEEPGFDARLILGKVSKQHEPDSPYVSEDDEPVSLPNLSRSLTTPYHQPGTSRQDPRNRFIYRADESFTTPMRPPKRPTPVTSVPLSTAPRSTAPSTATNSRFLTSERAEDEFDDDDDLGDVPTHTLNQIGTSQVLSVGEDEFDDEAEDDHDKEAINQSVRMALSQAVLNGGLQHADPNGNTSAGEESFGQPAYHSTQVHQVQDEGNMTFNVSYNNDSGLLNDSVNISKIEQQRRFLGLNESKQDPSQEYEILAGDSDEE